jgi:hypothetical protein
MPTQNGRVRIMPEHQNTKTLFEMKDRMPVNQPSSFRQPVQGLWENTQLSNAFFSESNVQTIQNGIRFGVFSRSNNQYIIGIQDYDTIKIVMRSIFLQNSKNQSTNISKQVEDLNKKVLAYSVDQVYVETQSYLHYLEDASTLVVPLSMPVNVSSHQNQLEQKPWF